MICTILILVIIPYTSSSYDTLTENYTYSDDKIRFYERCNESVLIILVSSEDDIILEDFYYKIDFIVLGEKLTDGNTFSTFFLTDGKEIIKLGGGHGDGWHRDQFRYIHMKLGVFNFTYDNRPVSLWTSGSVGSSYTPRKNISISQGKWYFVIAGGIYDLPPEDQLIDITVWINYSSEYSDLQITPFKGGKVFGLWYGEFDADLIVSKPPTFEMMLNGKTEFHIDNTFFYELHAFRYHDMRFLKIEWDTPDGIKTFSEYRLKDRVIKNGDKEDCIRGIGQSGDYKLMTSYFGIEIDEYWLIRPVFFHGIDIELP